jgi:hypothetical protein
MAPTNHGASATARRSVDDTGAGSYPISSWYW